MKKSLLLPFALGFGLVASSAAFAQSSNPDSYEEVIATGARLALATNLGGTQKLQATKSCSHCSATDTMCWMHCGNGPELRPSAKTDKLVAYTPDAGSTTLPEANLAERSNFGQADTGKPKQVAQRDDESSLIYVASKLPDETIAEVVKARKKKAVRIAQTSDLEEEYRLGRVAQTNPEASIDAIIAGHLAQIDHDEEVEASVAQVFEDETGTADITLT